MYTIIFAVIGVLCVTRYIVSFGAMIYSFMAAGESLAEYGADTGEWAVVTGASDGIGKQFALQLAQAGFNIVIIARRQKQLDEVKQEIKKRSPKVEVIIIVFDFSNRDQSAYDALMQKIGPNRIRVLVNNVGLSHSYPTPFDMEEMDRIQQIIDVNVSSVFRLTHCIVKNMKTHGRRSLVLNVSSFAGMVASPLLSVYSASKAALMRWSQALSCELKPQNIDVQCVAPYFVVSAMSKIKKPSLMAPTADSFVKSVLSKINTCSFEIPYVTSTYPLHAFVIWIFTVILPERFAIKIVHSYGIKVRKIALRKLG